MNRPARTLTRDLVRRRHPTGASPSRRNAPGRTLSPMPSEQKGAYGGHLALSCRPFPYAKRTTTTTTNISERSRLSRAALVQWKALDFSTGPLRAEKSLAGHPLDVVCDRGVVTIQAPGEFPNADARILRHILEDRLLERAQGHVAPQRHVAVRVVPAVAATLFRMDESLFLQDPQMVRRDAVLEANRIPDFREGGPGMLADGLIDQEADFPLEDLLPGEARMLERSKDCRRRDEDDPAHLGHRDPGEWGRTRAAKADGERRALPCPHGNRSGEGGCIAHVDPHLIEARRQLGEHQGRSGPRRTGFDGPPGRLPKFDVNARTWHELRLRIDVARSLSGDASEKSSTPRGGVVQRQIHVVIRTGGEALVGRPVRPASLELGAKRGVREILAHVPRAPDVDGTARVRLVERLPSHEHPRLAIEREAAAKFKFVHASISAHLNRRGKGVSLVTRNRHERGLRAGSHQGIPGDRERPVRRDGHGGRRGTRDVRWRDGRYGWPCEPAIVGRSDGHVRARSDAARSGAGDQEDDRDVVLERREARGGLSCAGGNGHGRTPRAAPVVGLDDEYVTGGVDVCHVDGSRRGVCRNRCLSPEIAE